MKKNILLVNQRVNLISMTNYKRQLAFIYKQTISDLI